MEVKKNSKGTKVLMELYNGEKIRTPILLSKALELIDDLPTSVELKENFISFENQFNQQILFQRLFNDVWRLELKFLENFGKKINLQYKHLRTRTVKAIVINFFYGIFVGTLDFGTFLFTKNDSRNQNLRKAISSINSKLEKYTLCKYCGMKLPYNLKQKCEFCGIELNFAQILLT
jgi:hypothetical protein